MKTTISRRAKNSSTTSRTNNRLRGAQTNAVHAGEGNKHGVGVGVGTPIARTSTFTFSSTAEMKLWAEGKSKAYIYSRYGNPTLAIAEQKIAALEGAEAAVCTASGMAAISSALLGALMAINLWLGLYRTPNEWPWTYFFLIVIQLLFVIYHAGRSLGADALIRERLREARTSAGWRSRLLALVT